VAIHRHVLYSPDRRWRISSDPAGNKIIIEYDLVLKAVVFSLSAAVSYLADQGISLADLVTD
jgi:hypothetical protein